MKPGGYVYYKKGYKYQTTRTHIFRINLYPYTDIITDYVKLGTSGILEIKKGYAWDGPSGPTIDTSDFMRGSLIHDALYQLIRRCYLGPEFRDEADLVLYDACIEDKMPEFRAKYVYNALREFGHFAATPGRVRKELVAPRCTK